MPKKEDMILQALTHFGQKLDTLDSRLDSVDKTLVKQEANLGEHMRRTELAEASIGSLGSKIESLQKDEIDPLKRHKAFMEGALKGIGLLFTIVSFFAALVKIISFFHH